MSIMGAPSGADKVGQYEPEYMGENIDLEKSTESIFEVINNVKPGTVHDLTLLPGFIELTDKDPRLIYADTDSAYILFNVPFNKYDDTRTTVNYIQDLATRLNECYLKALDFYLGKIGNWHKDFNTMDFKSEVVAFRGFFAAKKFYALGKIWDEGEYFDDLKTKITGGQLKKADVTGVTKEMLQDIYHLLTRDTTITDEVVLCRKIFIEIKNKYVFKLRAAIKELNFQYFSIPKKWSYGEKKTIPSSITGAKLYNRLVKDTFNVGDSLLEVPIKFDVRDLKNALLSIGNPNENMIPIESVTQSVKKISIPSIMTPEEKSLFINNLDRAKIKLNYDEIMDFNIDMKLEPFRKLFSVETTREALY